MSFNCLHYNARMQNKCGLLKDEYPCKGMKCEWYMDHSMRLASLVKAAQNFTREHPEATLRESGIIPDKWIDEVERSLTKAK